VTKPTTILYLHSSDELYGSDRSLLDLVSGLDRDQFRFIVVLPTDLPYQGDLSRALERRGIQVHRLDMPILRRRYFNAVGTFGSLRRLLMSFPVLLSIARRAGVDIVHSNTTAVLVGPLLAAALRVPHVWHVRELILRPRIVRFSLYSYVYNTASAIVCVSDAVARHLEASAVLKFHRCPVNMIRDDIDVSGAVPASERERARAGLGASTDHILVGMVGRISAGKGQEYFIEAAGQTARACPNARFAIIGGPLVGEGWRLERLREQVRARGLEQRLVVTGYRNDVPAVMSALDVFVLPSQMPEPMGRVVVEAMHAGAVPIVTNHGGAPEFVDPGRTGLLVSPADPSEAAREIVRAVSDTVWRRRMSAAARQAAAEFLTPALAAKMSRIYQSLAQPDPAPAVFRGGLRLAAVVIVAVLVGAAAWRGPVLRNVAAVELIKGVVESDAAWSGSAYTWTERARGTGVEGGGIDVLAGVALLQLRQWDHAVAILSGPPGVPRTNPVQVYWLGVALDAADRHADAIDVWIRGGFDAAVTARARQFVDGGDLADAAREYDQILARAPGNAAAIAGKGEIALRQSDWPAVITNFSAVLAQKPQDPEALGAVGLARMQLAHDYAGGVELLQQAIRHSPDCGWCYLTLAQIEGLGGYPTRARAACVTGQELAGADTTSCYERYPAGA
jgi:glycosyltransferase involved in cell wall biosynthesis